MQINLIGSIIKTTLKVCNHRYHEDPPQMPMSALIRTTV